LAEKRFALFVCLHQTLTPGPSPKGRGEINGSGFSAVVRKHLLIGGPAALRNKYLTRPQSPGKLVDWFRVEVLVELLASVGE